MIIDIPLAVVIVVFAVVVCMFAFIFGTIVKRLKAAEITITYNWDYENGYECHLEWRDIYGDREGLWARSKESWQAAREEAIKKYKMIPPSETFRSIDEA